MEGQLGIASVRIHVASAARLDNMLVNLRAHWLTIGCVSTRVMLASFFRANLLEVGTVFVLHEMNDHRVGHHTVSPLNGGAVRCAFEDFVEKSLKVCFDR